MKRFIVFIAILLATSVATAAKARAQQPDIRAQLIARGAPETFAGRVGDVVAAAGAEGLPTDPLAAKALEGWAKRGRVPTDRVISALEQLTGRYRTARSLVIDAGHASAPGGLVAAAGEALGRGLTPEQIRELVSAAPTAEAAATGITVASSLGGQGLETAAAVRAVRDAHREGRMPGELLEFPSVLADLIAQGVPMADVARMVLQGNGLPMAANSAGAGGGARPGVVPPGRGPVTPPPPGRRRPRNP